MAVARVGGSTPFGNTTVEVNVMGGGGGALGSVAGGRAMQIWTTLDIRACGVGGGSAGIITEVGDRVGGSVLLGAVLVSGCLPCVLCVLVEVGFLLRVVVREDVAVVGFLRRVVEVEAVGKRVGE